MPTGINLGRGAEGVAVQSVGYFLVLVLQVVSVLVHFAFVTFPLVAAWVWAFTAAKPTPNRESVATVRSRLSPPLAFPVAILVVRGDVRERVALGH